MKYAHNSRLDGILPPINCAASSGKEHIVLISFKRLIKFECIIFAYISEAHAVLPCARARVRWASFTLGPSSQSPWQHAGVGDLAAPKYAWQSAYYHSVIVWHILLATGVWS